MHGLQSQGGLSPCAVKSLTFIDWRKYTLVGGAWVWPFVLSLIWHFVLFFLHGLDPLGRRDQSRQAASRSLVIGPSYAMTRKATVQVPPAGTAMLEFRVALTVARP